MSISVVFYYTGKSHNSTYQPDSEGRTVSCELKYPCSIMSPVLRVNRGRLMDADPQATPPLPAPQHRYNYCYIANFERYYFASDIIEDGPFMEYRLTCDVLASFKSEIGSTSAYVLRSASSADGTIQDALYPTTSVLNKVTRAMSTGNWATNISGSGMFSVGIAGSGLTQYYLFEWGDMYLFLHYLLSPLYTSAVLTVLGMSTYTQMQLMVDPLQYITSIIWLPFVPTLTNHTAVSSIRVGFKDVDLAADAGCSGTIYRIDTSVQSFEYLWGNLNRHPDAATRGSYLNAGPYTDVEILAPGFGVIPLNALDVANATHIEYGVNVDLRTGTGTLAVLSLTELTPGNPPTFDATKTKALSQLGGRIGVPVQLSQVISAGTGSMSMLSAAIGAGMSVFAGNYLGAASAVSGAIEDIIKGQIPTANTIGSTGGFDSLYGYPALMFTFHDVTDADNAHMGRPLCQTVTISSLKGFILCAPQTRVTAPATEAEYDQIIRYMTTGFYYE